MNEIAARTAANIMLIQPDGPYRIAGYSSGGILAYATAHHLTLANKKVTFVGLIETELPDVPVNGALTLPSPKQILLHNLESYRSKKISLSKNQRKKRRLSLDVLIKEAIYENIIPPSIDSKRKWSDVCYFSNAVTLYKPRSINLLIHLFNALSEHRGGKDISKYQQNSLGWESILPVPYIMVHFIPGDHLSIVADENNRAILGREISSCLV